MHTARNASKQIDKNTVSFPTANPWFNAEEPVPNKPHLFLVWHSVWKIGALQNIGRFISSLKFVHPVLVWVLANVKLFIAGCAVKVSTTPMAPGLSDIYLANQHQDRLS